MKRLTACVVLMAFTLSVVPVAAVDGNKAAYFGGTHAPYADADDPVEGPLNTKLEHALVLSPEDKTFKGQDLTIPYSKIIDLEYGQKAGRRVGLAVGLAVINPIGL